MFALWWSLVQWYLILRLVLWLVRKVRGKPVLGASTPLGDKVSRNQTGPKWEQDVPYALSVDYEEDDL